METMRDIKLRARSVHQSLQVTTAMRLISTSKLRKAKRRLDETTPYFESIRRILKEMLERSGLGRGRWLDTRKDKARRRSAYLVITADRGLAGGYNNAVMRFVEERCPSGSILLPIGSVGKRYFMERDYVLLEDFPVSAKEPTVYEARDIAAFASELFLSGRIDEFRVIFTRMISTVKQRVEEIPLLPLDLEALEASRKTHHAETPLECLPDSEQVLDALVPKFLKGVIYGALVESFASEQAARMTAMDSASRNAKEMLEKLQREYNRARQGMITAEVSEIVAGAAALG